MAPTIRQRAQVTIADGAVGNLVPAVAYAAVGAYAAPYVGGTTAFLGVMAVAFLAWMVPRVVGRAARSTR